MALKIGIEVPWVNTRRHDLIAMPTRQLSRYYNITLQTATANQFVSNKTSEGTSYTHKFTFIVQIPRVVLPPLWSICDCFKVDIVCEIIRG